jgi:hypothetical protein
MEHRFAKIVKWFRFGIPGFVCILLLPGCFPSYEGIPGQVASNLKTMQYGGAWLNSIRAYQQEEDTLKLKSMYFLLEHMDSHYTLSRHPQSGDVLVEWDTETLHPDDVIPHIDQIAEVVRAPLQRGEIDFDIYLEYILPYRIAWEPVTPWLARAREQYAWVADSTTSEFSIENMVNICSMVNDDMAQGFRFGTPPVQARLASWEQLLEDKTGDCYTMTHLVAYPLRALGLPVTIDFISTWGNVNGGGHAWNALITGQREQIPFMGCETNPPDYEPFGISSEKRFPAKIFRKVFSSNPKSLPYHNRIKQGDPAPVYLLDDNMIDVTGQYLETATVRLAANQLRESNQLVYLATFTNGYWKPVFWSEQAETEFIFKDMAAGLLYIPVSYVAANQTKPIGNPFILDKNGKMKSLVPNTEQPVDLNIRYTQSKAMDELDVFSRGLAGEEFEKAMADIEYDKVRSTPEPGTGWRLYYWDEGWKHTATQTYEDGELIFKNVPSGALYRLSSVGQTSWNDRPFTYEDDKQKWW